MSESDVEIGLEVYESEFADFESGCEHRSHSEEPEFHEGSAEWYEVSNCTMCGHRSAVPVCDKYKRCAVEWMERTDVITTCLTCDGEEIDIKQAIRFEKK